MAKRDVLRRIDNIAAGGAGSFAFVSGAGGGGGVTDHGQLSGLLDDDHPGYLTPGRGALLFVPLSRLVETGATSGLAGGGALGSNLALSLAAYAAGAGLLFSNNQLSVGAGRLIEVGADSVGLADGTAQYQAIVTGADNKPAYTLLSDFAGAGMAFGSGKYNVGVANTGAVGLTVETDVVRLTSSSDPGAVARVLATNAQGSLFLDTNLLYIDAPNNRIGVNRDLGALPAGDGRAALDVLAANNADHTLRVKQKTGQQGRLWRVEDDQGNELIVLTSAGDLQSGNPGFVSGLTGWRITSDGILEAAHAWIRGEFHASIFVVDEFHSSGGTLFIAPSGKLENDAILSTDTEAGMVGVRSSAGDGVLGVRSANGAGVVGTRAVVNWLDVTDPPSGHAMVFSVGDRLRCKTLAMGVGLHVYDVWMRVTAIEDMGDYYRYFVTLIRGSVFGGGFGYPVLPAGAAIINYRKPGDGLIMMTADQQDAPYMQIFISGEEPWNNDIQPVFRAGLLDGVGLPGITGNRDYGLVLGRNLANANLPYFIASDKLLKSYRIDSWWNDGGSDTGHIGADGSLEFGTNIGQPETTGLAFDPDTGDVTIGAPGYPGTVKIYGQIYLPDGGDLPTFRWRGEWAAGMDYAKQDAVYNNGRSWITSSAHTAAAGNAPGVGAMWSILADQGATGPAGDTGATGPAGATAQLARLVASAQVFAVATGGTATPTTITLTAIGQNLTGTPTWSVSPGVTLTTINATTRTLAYSAMGANKAVEITITWGVYTDKITIAVVADGANGAPGANGTDGLTVVATNEAHTLPASAAGVVANYAGSGTDILVYEGATALAASANASTNGSFSIGTPTVAPAAAVTVGARTYSGTRATVAEHSALSAAADTATITYPVTIKRLNGATVTIEKVQTLTKSRTGDAGASVTVQYSVDGSTGWHSTFAVGDTYMRQSTNGGSTWSAAIRIVGESGNDGAPGADGNFVQYVFRRATTAPATPASNNVPSGWSDAPPAGTDPLWMSKATQTTAGVLVGSWSAPVRITGDAGSNAKLVSLVASSYVFAVSAGGTVTPDSIMLTANGQNVAGSPSFEITAGTGWTLSGTGSSRTLAYASAGSDSVTIKVTWEGQSDSVTIVRVRDGTDGTDGTDGADGVSGLTVLLSNEAHTLPADASGNVLSAAGSGTDISVWEGVTPLAAGGSGPGSFAVALSTNVALGARTSAGAGLLGIRSSTGAGVAGVRSLPLTTGAISYNNNVARVADHSAISSSIDLIVLTWQITITRLSGEVVVINRDQSISKSKTGQAGPAGPAGADNQDFRFLDDDLAALKARSAEQGMYLVNDYLGWFSGGANGDFSFYLKNTGDFKFGAPGAPSALEYSASANQLRGRSGSTTHWYADGSTGKFYAANGDVILDVNGIEVKKGSIVVGIGNKLWLNDGADGSLAIGGTVKTAAPFRVSAAGHLDAVDASFGTMQIDSNGCYVAPLTAFNSNYGYKFRYGANVGAGLFGSYQGSTTAQTWLLNNTTINGATVDASADATLTLRSTAGSNKYGAIDLRAERIVSGVAKFTGLSLLNTTTARKATVHADTLSISPEAGGEYTIWHSNNDGPDSGLNADTVDGKHASDFAWVGNNNTFSYETTFVGATNFGSYFRLSPLSADPAYQNGYALIYLVSLGSDNYEVRAKISSPNAQKRNIVTLAAN